MMDTQPFLAHSDDSDDGVPILIEKSQKRHRYSPALLIVLGLSLLLNLLFGAGLLLRWGNTHPTESRYARLSRDREEPYVKQTLYTSSNETLQAEMWHAIDIDAGMVALSDEWASAHDLRRAQRFPWDHSKGIYLLHGFHNLHCVKIVYNSLHEYRTSQPQSRNWHHVVHCLDGLRRQVICDADDTPRATDRRAEVVTGVGQHRMCRSWGALEKFAREHSACYKRPENPEDGTPIIERFKNCPEGTSYDIDEDYVPVDEVLEGLPEESQLDSAHSTELSH